MATATLHVSAPPLHALQRAILDDPSRFKVVAAGRRFGKTFLGVAACLKSACAGGRTWWIAPTFPIAQEGWRIAVRLCHQIPGAEVLESEKLITLPGGGSIQVKSSSHPESLRGAGLDGVVLDEAAFIQEEAWTEALRPTLTERQGWAIFISTPHGPNWFRELWDRAHALPGWAAWHLPTSANPHVPPDEVALARAQMPPAAFAQEYEASFETVANQVYEIFSRDRHFLPLAPLIASGRVVMERGGALGVDFGVVALSAALALTPDTAGRLWVRETWAEAGGNRDRLLDNLGRLGAKYGITRGRTDPTETYLAQDARFNAAKLGAGSRDGRISAVRTLLALGLSTPGQLPALCIDRDGEGNLELVREIETYHWERNGQGNLVHCTEAHKRDDRVAALEYAVEELVGGPHLASVSRYRPVEYPKQRREVVRV